MRKIKNRLLDTAYAATHVGHLLTSDQQLAADHIVAQFLNLDAEQRGWGIRWEVTRDIIGTERLSVSGGTREFNITRGALRLVQLRPGAIDEAALAAHAAKPEPYSAPWMFLWLLRLGLEPPVDSAEFRARAAEEWRRIRKNAIGDDFLVLVEWRDCLDREYRRDRIRWKDGHDGLAAVWKEALRRQGIEGIVPIDWPTRRGIPELQHHHKSRLPLREYTEVSRLRMKSGGWQGCFRQKAASVVEYILITPAVEAPYLAIKSVPTAEQRLYEKIGRLYKLNCWFDYLGRVPALDLHRDTTGVGFSYDPERAENGKLTGNPGARPDLMELERKHGERLKKGLPSDIRRAPQAGTVKISHPVPAIRRAELKRDMVDYNSKHESLWNHSSIREIRPSEAYDFNGRVSYADAENQRFNRNSLNAPRIDPLEAFAKLEKSHSWPLETKNGHHDDVRRTVHRNCIGDGSRRR